MISTGKAISDLLFLRDTVVVPGLGAFKRHNVSAAVDAETNRFAPPSSRLEFDADYREDNDLVINYIAEKSGCSQAQARHQLMLFVTDVFNQLKSGGKVALEHIGTLSYNADNQMVFEPDATANYNSDAFGLHDLELKPIVREEAKEVVKEEIGRISEPMEPELESEPEQEEDDEPVVVTKGAWALMIAMVIVMSVLYYFKVYQPKDKFDEKYTENQVEERSKEEEMRLAEQKIAEMVDRMILEELSRPYFKEPSKDTIRIIAGCYDQEEFAQRVVVSLKNKGFPNAFMEKRGERWFVAYGRYSTEEEAVAVLREIRESGKGKGWILK